jgi:hypothetical protein
LRIKEVVVAFVVNKKPLQEIFLQRQQVPETADREAVRSIVRVAVHSGVVVVQVAIPSSSGSANRRRPEVRVRTNGVRSARSVDVPARKDKKPAKTPSVA